MASKYSKTTGLPIGQGFYWKRDVIYVAIWHAGERHQFSCDTDKPEEARKFRVKKLAELVQESEASVERGMRCEGLLNRYIEHLKRKEQDRGVYMTANPKAAPSYKTASSIKHLSRFLKLKPKAVSSDMLTAYRDDRIAEGAGVVTVNRELGYLRAAMNRGVKDGKVNPLHVPRSWPINIGAERLAAKTGIITPDQYKAIMKVSPEHLTPILATVMYAGVRSKEIKFVRPEQVDWQGSVIHLRAGETKEGDARMVPMNDHVKEILLAWWNKTQECWPETNWFFHFEGNQIQSWKTSWHTALRNAGLRVKDDATGKWKNLVRFHDTRRTAITGMDEISLNEADVQVVSGHKTPKMARQYNRSKAAVERYASCEHRSAAEG